MGVHHDRRITHVHTHTHTHTRTHTHTHTHSQTHINTHKHMIMYPFLEKSPSDADLQRVLQEIGGYWHEVAISLGVPAQHVAPKDSNPLMAFLYWRNSSSESLLPPTWKCLFEAVCGIAKLGPRMVKHLKDVCFSRQQVY